MKTILCAISLFSTFYLCAQTTITGKVTDMKGVAIAGANVYLEGTYDGASTDADGQFSFSTSETGQQTLVVSFLSFENYKKTGEVSSFQEMAIRLREEVNSLTGVTLTAGTFKAGDNSKVSVLTPLDVVTTASALGDFVGALQTLPGTTTVAEDGRLFVRGGDAGETQIFIDGIRVFTPFTPTTNNIPTRGRYSPFLFDGITFSTGGYSAEYGQALSSVLLLNTINEPDQEKTDIGILSLGATLGNTQKWEKGSLSVNASYINLAPYLEVISDRNTWRKPFETVSGEAVFRHKTKKGLLKLYSAFDYTHFDVDQEDINFDELVNFQIRNRNLYFNGSYKGVLGNDWIFKTGASYTFGVNNFNIIGDRIQQTEHSFHVKAALKKSFSSYFTVATGVEQFLTGFDEEFRSNIIDNSLLSDFENPITGAFVEADIFLSKNLAAKTGIRTEYSGISNELTWSPRVSLALKTGSDSQLSFAYGSFYQAPENNILKFYEDPRDARATHYLLNYQYNKEGRTFRAEAFYKDYDRLVRFDSEFAFPNSNFTNDGEGFASGLDIFWRDNKSIKNTDYWISYSFLDTRRNAGNFPQHATPNFASTHNFSLVAKHWVESLKSQIGLAYIYASGRPFTNPNTNQFLSEKTKSFHNLSLNWAYLIDPQKILFFSVNNVLGFRNINGYQYANAPGPDGIFDRRALRPAADQFFFVGFFWTISDDKKSNQLNNL